METIDVNDDEDASLDDDDEGQISYYSSIFLVLILLFYFYFAFKMEVNRSGSWWVTSKLCRPQCHELFFAPVRAFSDRLLVNNKQFNFTDKFSFWWVMFLQKVAVYASYEGESTPQIQGSLYHMIHSTILFRTYIFLGWKFLIQVDWDFTLGF